MPQRSRISDARIVEIVGVSGESLPRKDKKKSREQGYL
jgi:hypothetical protein